MNSDQSRSPKVRVGLLFGGRSSEHTISLVTATSVLQHLDTDRFEPVPIMMTKQGAWLLVDPEQVDFSLADQFEIDATTERGAAFIARARAEVALANRAGGTTVVVFNDDGREERIDIDVFFPLLHGRFGEDGSVQGMLELFDRPYVGAGILTSSVAQDKHFTKSVLEHSGIAVAPWVTVSRHTWQQQPEAVHASARDLALPLFVKPARAGSSVGVSRVTNLDELGRAIEIGLAEDSRVLIERGIAGREIELGILGGRTGAPARASMPGEIVVDSGYYDFDAKYQGAGGARTVCPAPLPDEITRRLQETAIVAFEAIGGAGLARVDFFVTDDGEIVLNEINTLPGFTPISMYPVLWAEAGIGYSQLISELIDLALQEVR